MNRINQLFDKQRAPILNIYCTAGYPQLEDTATVIRLLEQAGADMIEVGMPYSDPLADGPTIQASSAKALENGMTLSLLFEQLQEVRTTVTIPLVLMGYWNPILQFGVASFLERCQQVGVDGLIIPDLPLYEYQQDYKGLFEQYGVKNIFLISPQTSKERILAIDECSDAFIYVVSMAGTTGGAAGFGAEQQAYFERIAAMDLENPHLIGFGIANHQTYKTACRYANGAIIGSAFIRMLAKSTELEKDIARFVATIRGEEVLSGQCGSDGSR